MNQSSRFSEFIDFDRATNVLNLEDDFEALGISSNYNGFHAGHHKRKGPKKSNKTFAKW